MAKDTNSQDYEVDSTKVKNENTSADIELASYVKIEQDFDDDNLNHEMELDEFDTIEESEKDEQVFEECEKDVDKAWKILDAESSNDEDDERRCPYSFSLNDLHFPYF